MPLVGNPTEWGDDTQQGTILSALFAATNGDGSHKASNCLVCERAYSALVPNLGEAPLQFFQNRDGKRVEMPRGKQRAQRLRWKIAEVHNYAVEYRGEPKAPAEPKAPKVEVVRDDANQREAQATIDWIAGTLRPFCEARSADGQAFDQIGLRPAENAAKMLTQGISLAAIKHSLTMHYPSEARRALGVASFDVTAFEARKWGGVVAPSSVKAHDGKHKALGYVLALAHAGLPIALVGPPGTGKTTLAKQLADELGRPFGFVSMTRGTSPSAFNGRPKIGSDGHDALIQALLANGRTQEALELAKSRADDSDVTASQFVKIYGGGGVFLFDEMDAAEPNLLLTVNAALANGHFANPSTGEIVDRHRTFVPVAGMNTLGLGGDRKMVGREKQDAAALDRWHAGRVEVALDPKLEQHLFWTTVAA